MLRFFRFTIVPTVASLALALISTSASAQSNWPSRPIELIIPWAAGGGVDAIGRAMASAMAADIGGNIVVVNRDGAGGTLGFTALAAAPADGHTLGGGPSTPIANAPHLIKGGTRYTAESFDYICQYFENVFAIAVPQESRFKSIADLLREASAAPGRLSYGHAGQGSIPHLATQNLAEALNIKVQAVPFRGDAPLIPVLLKGDLDFATSALSSIRGANLRVLMVFADKRDANFPDAPTAKEVGVVVSVPPGHNGLFAPKGLPRDVLTKLEGACAKAVTSETVQRTIGATGQSVSYLSSAQFRTQTIADEKFKRELIARLGLSPP